MFAEVSIWPHWMATDLHPLKASPTIHIALRNLPYSQPISSSHWHGQLCSVPLRPFFTSSRVSTTIENLDEMGPGYGHVVADMSSVAGVQIRGFCEIRSVDKWFSSNKFFSLNKSETRGVNSSSQKLIENSLFPEICLNWIHSLHFNHVLFTCLTWLSPFSIFSCFLTFFTYLKCYMLRIVKGRSPSWELCCRILSTSSGVRLNAASFAHSSPKSTLSTHCSLLVMSWETFLETFKFCIFNEI